MKRIMILTLAILLTFGVNAFGSDQWEKIRFADDDLISVAPSLMRINNEAIDRLLKNYREGTSLKYKDADTVTIEAGDIVCSNAGETIRRLRSNAADLDVDFTDLDTGAEAGSTTYYVYAVADVDEVGFTAMISLSSSAPTGATYYKRLGSFYNNSGSDVTLINNDNDNKEITTRVSKSSGVEYQASVDGYLYGSVQSGSPESCGIVVGVGDTGALTTVYSALYAQSAAGSRTFRAGFGAIPVRKGDYYKATWSGCSGTNYWEPKG